MVNVFIFQGRCSISFQLTQRFTQRLYQILYKETLTQNSQVDCITHNLFSTMMHFNMSWRGTFKFCKACLKPSKVVTLFDLCLSYSIIMKRQIFIKWLNFSYSIIILLIEALNLDERLTLVCLSMKKMKMIMIHLVRCFKRIPILYFSQ